MPIICVACNCGSSDRLVRTRLDFCGYRDFLTIPIAKGKEKSFSALNGIPQFPEVEMLRSHIKNTSTYAVILGYSEELDACRWVDIASGKAVINNVELKHIIETFAKK